MLLSMGIRTAATMMRRMPQRSVNTVTTNVPGPQMPLYACGRKMLEYLPFVPLSQVSLRAAVPIYYDRRYIRAFQEALENGPLKGFSPVPLGQLIEAGQITLRHGHGSPSHEQRVGNVPYLKVSDLRAGLVNINPTNRIPRSVAKKFWGGPASGLQAFDIVCPERTSKNIGDFCVLLPGQEQVVMTNEVIVLRPGPNAVFDSFYILWAMTLKVVRDQWKRVIFMQTNREDVGNRFLEIVLPVPKSDKQAAAVSRPFREYYTTLAAARTKLDDYLKTANHHFYLNGNQHNEP
jgi:type I restriction enzyme M protein